MSQDVTEHFRTVIYRSRPTAEDYEDEYRSGWLVYIQPYTTTERAYDEVVWEVTYRFRTVKF